MFFMLLLSFYALNAQAQEFFRIDGNRKRVTLPFQIVRNMIMVKVSINHKGPYNFILDTGVGLMLITDPALVDSININYKRLVKISSLGDGEDFEAYLTSGLNVTLPGINGESISAAILKKDQFGLSNYAGMPIHGLLGYEFFNSFAVHINFMDSTLTVGEPRYIRTFKRGNKLPLTVEDHKPYISTRVKIDDTKQSISKLIVDLGAGHPLLLENLLDENNGLPQKFIEANLGMSLTGPLSGYLTRIEAIDMGKYRIKNVITSFPDYDRRAKQMLSVKRDGNLGMEILRKFNMVIDYQSGALYIKPNFNFSKPFEHDMSGLEYYADGTDLKHIIISRVERGSAGDDIGLQKGDEIVGINFKPVKNMSLDDIDKLFRSGDGRTLLLEIFHDNRNDKVILTLKRRI